MLYSSFATSSVIFILGFLLFSSSICFFADSNSTPVSSGKSTFGAVICAKAHEPPKLRQNNMIIPKIEIS